MARRHLCLLCVTTFASIQALLERGRFGAGVQNASLIPEHTMVTALRTTAFAGPPSLFSLLRHALEQHMDPGACLRTVAGLFLLVAFFGGDVPLPCLCRCAWRCWACSVNARGLVWRTLFSIHLNTAALSLFCVSLCCW